MNSLKVQPEICTFRLGREDEEVVVDSLAMLEQGEVVALGRFEAQFIAASCP
jgi:hypothetical protein